MLHERLIALALSCGATKAVHTEASKIVLNRVFRDICASNGCGVYGKCWMCPPDAGDIDELMATVRSYKHALLFQTITTLEDSFDIEGMAEAGKTLSALCRRLRREIEPFALQGALVLGAGGCRACDTCTKPEGLACRKPVDALLSLEACGIDVYQTVKDTDLYYSNGPNTVTFFGMVLYH